MSEQPAVQLLPPPPQPAVQLPQQPPNCVTQPQNYKNLLQEYTQKSSLQLPVYQTMNEGSQHAPQFRSTVFVNGENYKSPSTFPQRKLAEQDVARVALDDITKKIKEDGRPLLSQDATFCKSILNEYAVKIQVEQPTYHTVQKEGIIPSFFSSVHFNGVHYTGGTGRSKKEAEQLAARTAILSMLDSDPSEIISKIIKSKFKLYAALYKTKESSSAALFPVHTGDGPGVPLIKRKEPQVTDVDINLQLTGISQSNLGEFANIQATHESRHAFKKPRPETPKEEISPPIAFVPAGSEQLQTPSPSLQLPSTLGVKCSRKSKKKAKKRSEVDSGAPTFALPLRQIPPCP